VHFGNRHGPRGNSRPRLSAGSALRHFWCRQNLSRFACRQPSAAVPTWLRVASRTSEDARAYTTAVPNLTSKTVRITLSKLTTIAFLLLLPAAASAQIPTRGNVFFGYSYGSADFSSAGRTNLNGWNGSLEGKVLPWVGFVADLSGLYGSQHLSAVSASKVNTSVNSVVLGPRVSVAVGKFTPFAHALFGVSHIHDSATGLSESDTSFATALGGGIDYRLIHGIGWRVQADMLQTRFFSGTQNNFRLSTGVVLHF